MFLFRWVMKTFLNPCFNPSLTTCPTTSAPWHKPLSLCKVSPAPCCGIQEELGGQVKTMHGECNRADWSVLCPTAVLCHLENYLAGDLGPGVLHVELAWGTVTKQEEIPVLGTLLILPRWWQPQQPLLLSCIWRRIHLPQVDSRSGGKFWGLYQAWMWEAGESATQGRHLVLIV